MATLSNKIDELKIKYPTLKVGDDVTGYTDLTSEEYEAKIADWAAYELDAETKAIEAEAQAKVDEQVAKDKATARAALLTQLGITEEQAKLLLG
jgi:uncharacterized protein YqfA (UPF0365 family)